MKFAQPAVHLSGFEADRPGTVALKKVVFIRASRALLSQERSVTAFCAIARAEVPKTHFKKV